MLYLYHAAQLVPQKDTILIPSQGTQQPTGTRMAPAAGNTTSTDTGVFLLPYPCSLSATVGSDGYRWVVLPSSNPGKKMGPRSNRTKEFFELELSTTCCLRRTQVLIVLTYHRDDGVQHKRRDLVRGVRSLHPARSYNARRHHQQLVPRACVCAARRAKSHGGLLGPRPLLAAACQAIPCSKGRRSIEGVVFYGLASSGYYRRG